MNPSRRNETVSAAAEAKMRAVLANEQEFYEFVVSRLNRQIKERVGK